jgi:hypothetical protein
MGRAACYDVASTGESAGYPHAPEISCNGETAPRADPMTDERNTADDGFRDVHAPGMIAGDETGGLDVDAIKAAYLKARAAARERQRAKRERDKASPRQSATSTRPERGTRAGNTSKSTRARGARDMSGPASADSGPTPAPDLSRHVTVTADPPLVPNPDHNGPSKRGSTFPPGWPERGRPTIWTTEVRAAWEQAFVTHLKEGGTGKGFTEQHREGPTLGTFYDWIEESPTFAESVSRARAVGAAAMTDDAIIIADSLQNATRDDMAKVNAARYRIETRKWLAGKHNRTFADRVETSVSGTVTHQHTLTDADRAVALAAIMARQAMANAPDLPSATRALSALPVTIDVVPEAAQASAEASEKTEERGTGPLS